MWNASKVSQKRGDEWCEITISLLWMGVYNNLCLKSNKNYAISYETWINNVTQNICTTMLSFLGNQLVQNDNSIYFVHS